MNVSTVRIEGGLLPAELMEQAALGEARGQRPDDFGLEKNRRLTDEIAAAWSDARVYWDALQHSLRRVPEGDPATTPTREQWVIPLLRALGYPQVTPMRSAALVDGQTYFVSHRAGESDEAPPVHIVGVRARLDERPPSGRPRLSPHALVQEYLNRTEHVWGIVTNGTRLRLLRDSSRMTRPAYVEFDLEGMLAGEKFSEFGILYRLLHRTRLPQGESDAAQCLLEGYYQEAIEHGGRVREKLRDGVEAALKLFGNGFLVHPANEKLRARVQSGDLPAEEYYRQLLRLIYRLLFLMVAEERGLAVPGTGTSPNGKTPANLYQQHYSVTRLRGLAEQSLGGASRHGDLWLGLLATFRLFAEEGAGAPLGVAALDGDLFGPQALPDLDDTHLANGVFLTAMRCLSLYEEKGIGRRVNYAALDVEELGSVYESLLDFRPVVRAEAAASTPSFDLVTGSDRKTTGSYYTRPELVQELINSALEPVIEDRLTTASTLADKERRLLALKVCDPACGSGHFLLAGARRIGRELARLRSGETEPTPTDFRRGVRDAIRHCIYGVDVNPLAVDLCKVALWMEAHVAGEPLTFLDHRIRLGNSLIGGFPMQVGMASRKRDLPPGIPDEAFNAPPNADKEAKKVASAFKKRNAAGRAGQSSLFEADGEPHVHKPLERRNWDDYARRMRELGELPDGTVEGVRRKQRLMAELRRTPEYQARKVALDLWSAAFLWPLDDANRWVPTDDAYKAWIEDGVPMPDSARVQIEHLTHVSRFFHWALEFPDVFNENCGGAGGFDVVLGNPPWERIKLEEEEHWIDEPYIVGAANKAERARRIEEYRTSMDALKRARVDRFVAAKHAADAWAKFLRASGRWPLTTGVEINTYAVFAELAAALTASNGMVGMVVPTAIASGKGTSRFFDHLVGMGRLVSITDFLEARDFFDGLESRDPFCLLTLAGTRGGYKTAKCAFRLLDLSELSNEYRVLTLEAADFLRFNPNTRTCAPFATHTDLNLARFVYSRMPILVDDTTGRNPWGVEYRQGLFHTSTDSKVLDQWSLKSWAERVPDQHTNNVSEITLLPLYKMSHFKTLELRAVAQSIQVNGKNRAIDFSSLARTCGAHISHWIPVGEVEARIARVTAGQQTGCPKTWERGWLIGFRDIARPNDERTLIVTVLPRTATDDHVALLFPLETLSVSMICALIGSLSSLNADYLVRQKSLSSQVKKYLLWQIPVPPPSDYSENDLDFVVPRVLALAYSSDVLRPFAVDLGFGGSPFTWSDEQRAHLRAQLDAFYFHKYGLSRKQVRYVLDPHSLTDRELATIMEDEEDPADAPRTKDFPGETFRVLKQNEERKYGEYRTQRLVLFYDRAIRDGEWSQFEMGLPKLGEGPEPKIGKDRERQTQERDTWRTGTRG